MRADHYDSKADVYSFGICLVATFNAEKNAVDFFFEYLRKHMKKKNRRGVGMEILSNKMLNQGWKPNPPAAFVQAYPKLAALIRRCWTIEKDPRPGFQRDCEAATGRDRRRGQDGDGARNPPNGRGAGRGLLGGGEAAGGV